MTQESNKLEYQMKKFLMRNYPVSRVKYMNHFKRAIVLDGGEIHLLNKETTNNLKNKLITILGVVFATNEELNKRIVEEVVYL